MNQHNQDQDRLLGSRHVQINYRIYSVTAFVTAFSAWKVWKTIQIFVKPFLRTETLSIADLTATFVILPCLAVGKSKSSSLELHNQNDTTHT